MSLERLHLVISGRVQGVSYRVSARKKARKLRLRGWVKNRDDGGVELVAEGTKDALEGLLQWCHRGPLLARVDTVAASWSEATGEFDDFEVRR